MQPLSVTSITTVDRPSAMGQNDCPQDGSRKSMDDKEFIFYHGYWIRYYTPPEDTLAVRKRLIDHLTRRAFHHTEPGINTPGDRLELAQQAYAQQADPALKRVNGAMLAGALFNRATDIFTAIVELEEKGVKISRDNELMKSCGNCFKEALELGRQVRHHSGEEGIDELWGEPFRAFTMCVNDYFQSRYIKVAQTMANIDKISDVLLETFSSRREYADITPYVDAFASAAKCETETMRSDTTIFEIWPKFVAAGEALANYEPAIQPGTSQDCLYVLEHAQACLQRGRDLINWISRARVPMPKSTTDYIEQCRQLKVRLDNC